ncbi:MAG: TonB-dependent receptor domain-containing protein [Acidobacteriota bacterium]
MKNLRLTCLLFVVVTGLCAAVVTAQSSTATVTGTVKDASGAVIPGVEVVIIHVETNRRAEAVTNDQGIFNSVPLAVGEYRLEAEIPGFKRAVRTGITLQVQQAAVVDFVLEIGEVAEQVLVKADASVLEPTTSSVGKVVDNRRIVDLPLNTRNVYTLIFLTPGVTGSIGNNYGDMRYSVNGARQRMHDTLVDGVSASHPTVNGGGGISVFPSVDAIEEFKVMGANFPAEFGRSQGSVLNVVFKSGGNQLHGSAYGFLRNSAMDANNFFNNSRNIPLGSFKRSQFGGTILGPIVKDRTFFLGSYEGLRERGFRTTTFTVPTLLERQGDFSKTLASNGQLIRIFDPFTTRANPSGSGFIRDQFTGNVIMANRFDPVALQVLKFYPAPNTPGNPVTNQNNYTNSGSSSINLGQFDVRIDHNISADKKFFTRYSRRLIEDVPPVLFPEGLANAEGRVNQEDHVHSGMADYTQTLSPNTVLSGRLGFSRTLFIFNNQGLGFKPSSLGLPAAIDQAVDRQMFPRFNASNYVSLGGNDHRYNAFMNYTASASISKVLGSHTWKMGFEGRMIRVNVWEARDAGAFSFSAGMTQGPNPTQASSTAGNSIASLLLGTGSSGNLIQAWKNVASQSFYYAGYLQDDWRVTRRLTLNLGLRYDVEMPRTERYNRMNYFDPYAPSPLASTVPGFSNLKGGVVFVGVGDQDRTQFITDKNNFAPRVGLAYQLDTRTVIRAGYGHIYGLSPQAAQGTIGPFGFRVENPWVTSLDNITPFNRLSNPYPQGFQPPPGASRGLLTGVGGRLEGVLRDTVTPWSQQWNLTVQRELPSQILMEVAYVGTRGLQLSRNGEGGLTLNQLDPKHMALGSQLNQLVDNPFFGIVNSGVLINQRISRAQLLRPYPQFTDIIPLFSSGSSSIYHALQATFSKRLSAGLQFDGSYTWAKSLDDGESHQDSYNVRASRSLSDIDLSHRLVMSYIYELPFGQGRRFGGNGSELVEALLGGWQINGITTFQSGTPLAISATNSAGIFSQAIRANNNGTSGRLTTPVHTRLNAYFDKSVFSQPLNFTFGNMSTRLSDIRNDGVRNFDLSLFKEFAATERMKVQFRAEALNAFNTPRFGSPNTSVTSSSFGVITSQANSPRQIQLGLKLLW